MPDPPLPPSPGEPSSLTELKHLSSTLQATAEALCRSSRASEATAAHGAASAKVRAALAEAEVALRLLAADAAVAPVVPRAEVRVWMDGAFDMMHFGHANAFRQGKALGTHLIVGVNSDASITEAKGAPIMNDAERTRMVRSCKFVNEVVENVPYVMDADYVRHVLQKHRVDLILGESEHRGKLLRRSRAFLSTSRMNSCFARGTRAPAPGAAVVYVAGAFDLFHAGHVAFLEAARGLGDYLVVGVHGDAVVAKKRGDAFPVMNMQERALSVLGCRFVDDCLFDAPLHVSETMVQSFKITVVAVAARGPDAARPDGDRDDPFAVPKKLGLFTTKAAKEEAYYDQRHAA
ncbi:cytidylyltransferase [Aureococcus anophagefferens]|nr:cytidylyltransferase [Aureococcus anophagefferens]